MSLGSLLEASYSVRHIYREFNALADSIANEVVNNGQDLTEDWFM